LHDENVLILLYGSLLIGGLSLLLWFAGRELRRTRRLFAQLAVRFGGRTQRFPLGMVFRVEPGVEVKVFALQGSILYRARMDLGYEPDILVARIYRGWRFIDKLNYAPGRTRYRFHAPIDRHYSFRVGDGRHMKEIFAPDLLERMQSQGRITRLEIRRNRFRAALMVLSFSPEETHKAEQSIAILNELLKRVRSFSE